MLGFILHLIKIMPISDVMYYAEPISALALAGIGAGIQALTGIGQLFAAGPRKKAPEFKVSPFEEQSLELSREMAQTGMPVASEMMAAQKAQQAALFGMKVAQDRRGGLAAIGNIQAGLDRTSLQIAAQDALMRQQRFSNYETALLRRAQTDYRAFQNQAQQYANEEMRRASMAGAGIANFGRAGSMFGQAAMMSLNGNA